MARRAWPLTEATCLLSDGAEIGQCVQVSTTAFQDFNDTTTNSLRHQRLEFCKIGQTALLSLQRGVAEV
jgi:hypothetical protein